MYDIVIKNGRVVDGSGIPAFAADIGIVGDCIVLVGRVDGFSRHTINAEGCIVCPGFIDVHSHTDEMILVNPVSYSKVTQGVTTEVCGNCGDSPAPRGGLHDLELYERRLAEYGIEPNWRTIGDFLHRLDEVPKAINFGTLVGHGTVRSVVMGFENRSSSPDEINEMCRLVEQGMLDGAFGLSSGLVYPPGCFAETNELIALCRVVARFRGIYSTHMRNEREQVLDSIRETVHIAQESGVSLQISHLKAYGCKAWGRADEILELIDEARNEGIDVWGDQYPYIATSTSLSSLLPQWAHEGGHWELNRRLTDEHERRILFNCLLRDSADGCIGDSGGWGSILISSVRSDNNRCWEGCTVAEAAMKVGKHPADFVLDLLLEEDAEVGVVHFAMNEQDVEKIMRHKAVLVASDAVARCLEGPLGRGKPHPRTYGAFVRVLGRYARDKKVFPIEEAIAKMTGWTARRLSLVRRGFIAEGCFADIVVFDEQKVSDTATFEQPHSRAVGIRLVMVNGKVVVEDGEVLKPGLFGPGYVLRKSAMRIGKLH